MGMESSSRSGRRVRVRQGPVAGLCAEARPPLAACFFALLATAATAATAAKGPPEPVLDRFEPGVREVLEEGLERFAAEAGANDPVSVAEAWGRLGMLYQAHHLQDLAADCYREAVALAPDSFRWHYLFGFALQEQGAFAEAEFAYEAAVALEPDNANARLRRAQVRAELGRDAEAAADLRRVLALDPTSAAAHAELGRLALRERHYDDAIDELTRALELDPRADRLHYPLAIAYRGRGDLEQARAHMARQGETDPAVRDPLLAEMSALTRSAQIYLEAAYAAARAGRDREALAQFRKAVAFNPEDAAARLGLGQALLLAGDYGGAEVAFDRAVELMPEDPVARYRRGTLYALTGRDEPAVADLEQAVAADPDNLQAGLRLADALMRLERYDAAADAYARLTPSPGAEALILYRHGLAVLAAGDCFGAAALFEEALLQRPNSGEIIQALARTYATCTRLPEERGRAALDRARALFDARADAAHADTLALAAAAAGDFDQAVALQERLLEAAERAGDRAAVAWHESLLQRFRAAEPALRAWPPGHPVFRPGVEGAGPDRMPDR
jgi:tetratricopeptide (TPR) repeat protein